MTDKPSYSHSKLDIARDCFLKYKFQYIDKIKGKKDTSATDFGEVSHTIMENYKGTGKTELLKLYKELVPSKYKLTPEYLKRVPISLKNIHTIYTVLNTDKNIIDIKHEENISINYNDDFDLNGKIDLTIKYKSGNIKIIDFKTNKSSKFANHKNQLSLYMLLINKKYGIDYEKIETGVNYLALEPKDKYGNKILNEGYENINKNYKLDEVDVQCLENEIRTIHSKIEKNKQSGIWKENPSDFKCKYCQFNKLCTKSVYINGNKL